MPAGWFDCNAIPDERKNKIQSDIVLLILRSNDDGKPIWYGKIKDTLVPAAMTRNEFECAFTYLEDMCFIRGRYGSLGDGRCGMCWRINERHIDGVRAEVERKGIKLK